MEIMLSVAYSPRSDLLTYCFWLDDDGNVPSCADIVADLYLTAFRLGLLSFIEFTMDDHDECCRLMIQL